MAVPALRARPDRRGHRPARSLARRRTALRAVRETDGRERQLAHPASRQRTVFGQTACVHGGAGRGLHRARQLAHCVPAAVAARGARDAVARLRSRAQASGITARASTRRGALLAAFQFVYQAKRAQIDPSVTFFITLANYGLLRHFLLGPDWRAYWLGCFAAGLGVITKGVGVLALFMFAPYVFARFAHWQHASTTTRATWRWLAGVARVRRRRGAVARADAARRAQQSRARVRGLCARHPVSPDRGPLHRFVGSPAPVLVLRRRDHHELAAARARVAGRRAALARRIAPARCACPAAARVGRADRHLLHAPERQARRLHHAGAADVRARRGALSARRAAAPVGAPHRIRTRTDPRLRLPRDRALRTRRPAAVRARSRAATRFRRRQHRALVAVRCARRVPAPRGGLVSRQAWRAWPRGRRRRLVAALELLGLSVAQRLELRRGRHAPHR